MTHEMNIVDQKKNALLGREEIVLELEHKTTPSYAEIETMIHEKFKTDKGAIAVKGIKGLFGSKHFRIKAFLYDSASEKEKIEPKKKVKKNPGEAKEEPKAEVKK